MAKMRQLLYGPEFLRNAMEIITLILWHITSRFAYADYTLTTEKLYDMCTEYRPTAKTTGEISDIYKPPGKTAPFVSPISRPARIQRRHLRSLQHKQLLSRPLLSPRHPLQRLPATRSQSHKPLIRMQQRPHLAAVQYRRNELTPT